jgi:phospholipid/cholesterol/gamma-HCH transport system substrate-binding protein
MRQTPQRLKLTALGVFLAVCVVVFGYLFTIAGGRLPLGDDAYTVSAVVPDPFQLVRNGDVRQAGVKIGTITDVEPLGTASKVTLRLRKEDAPLYRSSRILVRTKTLVGENYLDVQPGTPASGTLPDGATLPVGQADEAVQLDKILSSLDAPTRRRLRQNLDGLDAALDGRGGDVSRLFAALNPTVTQGAAVTSVLARQRTALANVIQRTGRIMQVFGDRTADVRALATQARRVAAAAASRDRALGATLDELPSTLKQAQSTAGVLGGFSGRATPVLRDLTSATASLQPVVRDLGPAAVSGRRLFARLPAFLDRAEPLLGQLRTFAGQVRPAVPQADALLRQLNPAISYLAPYAKELGSFFTTVGSTTDVKDNVAGYLRVQQYYSPTSLAALTPEEAKALKALTATGVVSRLLSEGRNAYPKPGAVAAPGAFSGLVPRVPAAAGATRGK